MKSLALLVILLPSLALATKPGKPPEPTPYVPSSTASQSASTSSATGSATAQADSTASGGAGGDATAQGGASSSNALSGDSIASLSMEDRSTTIALASTSPNPAAASGCYIPKRKFGRGWSALWGGVSVSAILERDEKCIADQIGEHERYVVRLRAEAELERARAERLRREIEFNGTVGAK